MTPVPQLRMIAKLFELARLTLFKVKNVIESLFFKLFFNPGTKKQIFDVEDGQGNELALLQM